MTSKTFPLPSRPTSMLAETSEEKQLTRNWIVYGAIAGILGFFAYVSAIAPIPLPEIGKIYLGMAFGPLVSLAFVGLYHFFKLDHQTVVLQATALFGVIAGTIVNVMIVVQSAIHLTIPAGTRESLGLVYAGLDMVQLGMDISWYIYFSIATILLGLVMFSHPRFGKIWGIIAVIIGTGLLTLNLAAFPIPPENAGLFDLGLVSGGLFLLVAIRVLTSLKWVDVKLNG